MNLDKEKLASCYQRVGPPLVYIGTGEDVTIRELAETIARVVDFSRDLAFATSRPDGSPRKLPDMGRIRESGWRHSIELQAGSAGHRKWYEVFRVWSK